MYRSETLSLRECSAELSFSHRILSNSHYPQKDSIIELLKNPIVEINKIVLIGRFHTTKTNGELIFQ